jgi:hypothetical protein
MRWKSCPPNLTQVISRHKHKTITLGFRRANLIFRISAMSRELHCYLEMVLSAIMNFRLSMRSKRTIFMSNLKDQLLENSPVQYFSLAIYKQ